jgi:hypothetical protein
MGEGALSKPPTQLMVAGAAGFVPSLKTPPTVNGVLFVVVLTDPTGELQL